MRLFATIILYALFHIASPAQNNADIEVCHNAESAYSIGQFDKAISMIGDNMSIMTQRTLGTAYRLLALCYIEKDDLASASKYAGLLLKANPYYVPSFADPLRFADLVETLRKNKSAIIITASQQEEKIEEAPVPVTLITEDMIRESGTRNLRELLCTYIPGITPVEGEEYNISMRGTYSYSNENILIMRNGQRLNSRATNSMPPDFRISLDNVKQIEVLRGAASSLYGNVALSAVVNIITKNGEDIKGIKASGGVGDNDTFRGSVVIGNQFANSDFIAWASIYSSDGYRHNIPASSPDAFGIVKRDGYIYVDGFNSRPSYDIGARFFYNNLMFSISHQYGKRVHTYNSLYILSTYDYDKYAKINDMKPGKGMDRTYASVEYQNKWKNTSLYASVSMDLESTDMYNVIGDTIPPGWDNIGAFWTTDKEPSTSSLIISSGGFGTQGWKCVTFGGDLRLTHEYAFGKQKGNVLVGMQYEHFNSYRSYAQIGKDFDRIAKTAENQHAPFYTNGTERNISLYSQMKHYFSQKIILNCGLRFDMKRRFTKMSKTELSPRLSLIYVPSSMANLKLSYAHSFVDAPFFYRAAKIMYIGNEALQSQQMNNIQFTGAFTIVPQRLEYEGNLFYNSSSDVILMTAEGYRNTGKLAMAGIESILTYRSQHLKTTFNGIWQKRVSSTNYPTLNGKVNAIPEVKLNLLANQELWFLTKNLWLNAKISFTSEQEGVNTQNFVYKGDEDYGEQPYKIGATCLADIGASYQWKNIGIDLWAYNIFSTKYRLGGDRVPVLQPARTLTGTLSVKF